MNKLLLQTRVLALAGASLLIAACSSGDVNVSANVPAVTPVPFPPTESITAYGVIGGFGDVLVNDVRYEADRAAVTINGQPGTLADLERGQVVTVTGTVNGSGLSGTADTIRFDANLIGPVENLDVAGDRLTVMGQTVKTGPDTIFAAGIDPVTFAGLSVGTPVRISGFADAAGAIEATRIDTDTAGAGLQVVGRVTGLDPANLLFTVNRLTVDYSSVLVIDLPGGAPANAMMLRANGTMSDGLFVAERLHRAPSVIGSAGQRVQIAGMITRFESPGDFDVHSFSVTANSRTAYSNGGVGDLFENAEVRIDGDFSSTTRIAANRIRFGRLVDPTAMLTFDLSGFTEITIPTVFDVTVTQGPEFLVEVIVDEDAADRVNVTQTGATLNLALALGDGNINTLQAFVTMPVLDRIDLTGVAHATLNGFSQQRMTVNVGGVSRLQGNDLTIGVLTAHVSGVSQLAFGDIRPLGRANIAISGVSQATLNMDVAAELTGSVSTGQGTGISTLFYYGTNVDLNVMTGPVSSVVRLGDTRS